MGKIIPVNNSAMSLGEQEKSEKLKYRELKGKEKQHTMSYNTLNIRHRKKDPFPSRSPAPHSDSASSLPVSPSVSVTETLAFLKCHILDKLFLLNL